MFPRFEDEVENEVERKGCQWQLDVGKRKLVVRACVRAWERVNMNRTYEVRQRIRWKWESGGFVDTS
jgi:hypothetical protein